MEAQKPLEQETPETTPQEVPTATIPQPESTPAANMETDPIPEEMDASPESPAKKTAGKLAALIGGGIALPHACNAGVSAPGISALLLRRGVDWGAPDGKPVDLVFMIAVPPGSESLHLQILARLVNLMSRSDLVESLRTASNPLRFVELIAKAENACFAE